MFLFERWINYAKQMDIIKYVAISFTKSGYLCPIFVFMTRHMTQISTIYNQQIRRVIEFRLNLSLYQTRVFNKRINIPVRHG